MTPQRKEHLRKLQSLPERDHRILLLARKAVNAMGFACQGAEQQNDRMQIRYEEQSNAAMRELEDFLTKDL